MMLLLRVVGWPEGVAPTPIFAHFDAGGGLIGRSETARLALPDPERKVSRFHAHVSCFDDVYYLEDMGSTNPPSVNGTVLGANQRSKLAIGDRIRIGDYTLVVEMDEPALARDLAAGQRGDGWGDEDSAHTQIVDPDVDELPLTGPTGRRTNSQLPTGSMFARELGQELARGMPPAPPAQAPVFGVPRAPLADQGLTELVPRTAPVPATPDELWRAFQEGAGVAIDLPQGLRPELMRTIGSMLRSVIGGLRRLVLMRAQAKQEVEAEVTQLRARNNNPLKFATDDTRALTALLKPPPAGFLPGPAAIDDALGDLESHQAATLAAMRAAIEQVVARFEPDVLERRLASGGGLSSFMPLGRKARLWDLYVAQYRAIGSEAREGFRDAFERAFVTAYETEVARIERERKRRA